MARMRSVAPVLPVRDVPGALDRYAAMGFQTQPYEGGGYGYLRWDQVQIHLAQVDGLDPATSMSALYLYVDSADDLYSAWSTSGVDGRHHEPVDTDYGLREGAYVDQDGNLLRYGSPQTDRAEVLEARRSQAG